MRYNTSPRAKKRQQTWVDVVEAALSLFEEHGYDATTVDEIVERANCSRSTFFRYFGSKEDVLFLDVPERVASGYFDTGPAGDPWKSARTSITRNTLSYAAGLSELEAKCVAMWFTEPDLQRRYRELQFSFEQALVKFLAAGWGCDPNSVECQVIANAMVAVGRAAMQAHEHDPAKTLAILKTGFDLLEDGVRATTKNWKAPA